MHPGETAPETHKVTASPPENPPPQAPAPPHRAACALSDQSAQKETPAVARQHDGLDAKLSDRIPDHRLSKLGQFLYRFTAQAQGLAQITA